MKITKTTALNKLLSKIPMWLSIIALVNFDIVIGILSMQYHLGISNIAADVANVTNADILMIIGIVTGIHFCKLPVDMLEKHIDLGLRKSIRVKYFKKFDPNGKLKSTEFSGYVDDLAGNAATYLVSISDLLALIPSITAVIVKLRNCWTAIVCLAIAMLMDIIPVLIGVGMQYPTRSKVKNKTLGIYYNLIVGKRTISDMGKRAEDFYSNKFADAISEQDQYQQTTAKFGLFRLSSILFIIPIMVILLMDVDASAKVLIMISMNTIECLCDVISTFMANVGYTKEYKENIQPGLMKAETKKKAFTGLNLNNIKFTYNDAKDLVFNIENVVINKFEKVLLTGESGQGKTSFTKLLMQQGMKQLTGKQIEANNIVYMGQDTQLFDYLTIRDNIKQGQEIEDEEIYALMDELNLLGIDLDTVIENGGSNISAGQKQRINIIRIIVAMLRTNNETLFILDEPTSNLDKDTEALAVKTINKYCKQSAIIITHNPAAFKAIVDGEIRAENHTLTMVQ